MTEKKTPETPEEKSLTTFSTRFVGMVESQFKAEIGTALAFTEYEQTLAQHMFLKADGALKAAEEKRLQGKKDGDESGLPITWENVNLQKMALDTVHRVGLGLDALIPNHIHVIPYYNKRMKKYDIDLRIGYAGKDYCRRQMAVETPKDITYQLIYSTDKFRPIMKDKNSPIESYEFEITNPFDRGDVIGGFGYIQFKDQTKNKLVIVTKKEFEVAKKSAKTNDFWAADKHQDAMIFKTVVHRVAEKLPMDPKRVNAKSYAYVEAQENAAEAQEEISNKANQQAIDVSFSVEDQPEQPNDPTPAADQQPKGPNW